LRIFCFTLIGIALISSTVALVVSWLLASGVINPQDRGKSLTERGLTDPEVIITRKEARFLDYNSSINQLTESVKNLALELKVSEENLLGEISKDLIETREPPNNENTTASEEVTVTAVRESEDVSITMTTEQTLPMTTKPDEDDHSTMHDLNLSK